MQKHTLFISDLHLESTQPDITRLFFDFLNNTAIHADALYILGDFFEVWIGDDDKSVFNCSIKHALKEFSARGIPVFFMRGNRDFLIGEKFALETGCHLLADPTLINLYGKSILLTHGDTLCTADIKHQKFRHYAHNPNYFRYFLMLPLWLRKWIARKIRNQSQQHTKAIPYHVMDISEIEVIRMFEQYHFQELIHGHTHRPNIHSYSINKQSVSRIVLGAWHERGSALIYYANGSYELLSL